MTEAVAFDLDGTLIDCRKRQVDLAAWAVQAVDGDWFDPVGFWTAKRTGLNTQRALVAIGIPPAVARSAATLWCQHIEEAAWLVHDTVLPGAVTALNATVSAGFVAVVLTARRDAEAALAEIHSLGLGSLIGHLRVVSPEHATIDKAVYLQEAAAIALVGDSEVDAAAATAAGLPFFAVTSGQRDESVLATFAPEVVVGEVAEAVRCLLDWWSVPRDISI